MNGGGYWQTTYHYDDILIMKFDNNGKLDWSRSVFKKAQSPSYNAFIKNDELHVILNSGKNLNEKKDGIVAKANANIAERLGTTEEIATTLVLVVLSEYGKFLNVFDKH